jgi:hypothetical protein
MITLFGTAQKRDGKLIDTWFTSSSIKSLRRFFVFEFGLGHDRRKQRSWAGLSEGMDRHPRHRFDEFHSQAGAKWDRKEEARRTAFDSMCRDR